MPNNNDCVIKIAKDGPYIVSGNVPIDEKIIVYEGDEISYKDGRTFPHGEVYALCRCGNSKNMPFCDGSHTSCGFNGKEKASKKPYLKKADVLEGPDLILTDDASLCAFARFCHKEHGSVWELTRDSGDPILREEAIKAACDCPAGRLVAWDKETNTAIEPHYEPSITIIQDPLKNCSGPIWVKGGIRIESSDGTSYEVRNRVTLCRCGKSKNKPFCDAIHVSISFDNK